MTDSGTLLTIWIKRAHRGVMDPVSEATLVEGKGIDGNVDRSKRRQVTIVDEAAWTRATDEVDVAVKPAARRANLFVRGVDLENSRGRVLRIGDARLLIGGETRPCERMEEAQPGLRAALDPEWRGGAFAEVLTGGIIKPGDAVVFEAG